MTELEKKERNEGVSALTEAEVQEWANLRGAMSNIDASRNLLMHRAQLLGGSEDTSTEIANIMGHAGIASAAGIAGGVSKAGSNSVNATAQVVTKNMDPGTLISRQNKNEMSGSQVKRLVKDMKANGFDVNEPVDVAIVNGKAIIIDGHHRAEAAVKAGIKDIPFIIQ
ncbi:ParB N-terminal domain-containing protein [Dickeya fangzhongdai]